MEDLLMSYYKNEQCPICLEKFKDGDQIVVCPECGTPYHKQCYDKIGHCIYESKHGDYYYTNPKIEYIKKAAVKEKENDLHKVHCSYCDELNDNDSKVCKKCGMPLKQDTSILFSEKSKIVSEDKISGIKVKDWFSYLGLGAISYLIKFKFMENRRYSLMEFNFSAFIFGEFYFIYRKMYLVGMLFFIARMLVISFIILLLLPKSFVQAMISINFIDFFQTLLNMNENYYCSLVINNIVSFLSRSTQAHNYITFANFALSVIMGASATRIYKKISIKRIKSIDKNIYASNIAYRNVLMKKGSVSYIAVLIAMFVFLLIITV